MSTLLTPRQAINKAFLKIKPIRSDIENFKSQINLLIDNLSANETEEHQKNLLINFFKKTYYGDDYFINTKDRIDLAIRNGNSSQSTVGVLFEIKRTTNSYEMLSQNKINTKALQELVLYYLRERITQKNIELKHVIATNINEWFIFDANIFEKLFAQNKKLVKAFSEFELDDGKDTSFFYDNIAKDAIEQNLDQLVYTYFDINSYKKSLKNTNEETKLIALYKLLSPEHLLKKPFLNDSNSLNKNFYAELLHLIGLEEVKVGSKKLIERKKDGDRNLGSLLESAILLIKSRQKLYQITDLSQYGETEDTQLQSIAMELVITWINRILFLKLLEAQLIKYNKGNKNFSFLNSEKIKGFDELESLFFQVLAVRPSERDEVVKEKFSYVPYLNSSLFEPTHLEHEAIGISSISDGSTLPILSSTVLKDEQGKRKDGNLNTLTYLFEFLNAYDFTSDGGEEIQEDNKTLISASVLGLIFEKINGYKDGSFFTPSFVTMYMCREVITQVILKKFKDIKGYDCKNLIQLHNEIEDKEEANQIINSIKICDPAVGSGHFLVSALNEIIFVKSQLGLLHDKNGKSLKNYDVDVVNDELIITDEEGEFVNYFPKNSESQRVQETIFNEKQAIIENCLFGVDINPNSVKICRLRLWIELLKNAYYKDNGELETLPNIDINIKVGDSLIGRFGIDSNLKDALKKSKISISEYKSAVSGYKNATNKSEKRSIEQIIQRIKSGFKTEILQTDSRYIKLWKLEKQLIYLDGPQSLFELDENEIASNDKLKQKLTIDFQKAKSEIEEIESNKIYANAFEWRFEFSEVLNDDGNFLGFDVVIGNPPYIDSETMINEGLTAQRDFISNNYKFAKGNWDIYIAFFERGLSLLRSGGLLIYITPDKWLSKGFGLVFRQENLSNLRAITKVGREVFESAKVDSIITQVSKTVIEQLEVGSFYIGEYKVINRVDKSIIQPPYTLDFLLSDSLSSLSVVDKVNGKVGDYLVCENACATSDCYLLKEHIEEFNDVSINSYYTVVNTGTLSKYISKWGVKEMTYLKSKYLKPVVKKDVFAEHFKNSYYTKTNSPKLIVKGLTKLDVSIDLNGTVIAGKSTLIFASNDINKLKLMCGVLNSRLAIKYIAEKHSSASYNGGINFTKDMLNNFPFPLCDSPYKNKIVSLVDQVLDNDTAVIDAIQNEIDILVMHLYGLSFVDAKELFGGDLNISEDQFNFLR